MTRALLVALVIPIGALAGCGAESPPPQPPRVDTAPPAAPPTVEILNTCDKDVTFHYGPQAAEGTGKETTLAPHMTTTIPREANGVLAVWLVNKGAMAKVTVTQRMRKVEIGRSCWTLDAHD